MQFTPRSAAGRAVLFNRPFAGPAKLQASAVHQQMQRPVPDGEAWSNVLLRRLNGRVIRHRESEAEQIDDGADEPLGLPQCQTEDCAHRQRRGDRQGRIMRLPAGRGRYRSTPSGRRRPEAGCRTRRASEPGLSSPSGGGS